MVKVQFPDSVQELLHMPECIHVGLCTVCYCVPASMVVITDDQAHQSPTRESSGGATQRINRCHFALSGQASWDIPQRSCHTAKRLARLVLLPENVGRGRKPIHGHWLAHTLTLGS